MITTEQVAKVMAAEIAEQHGALDLMTYETDAEFIDFFGKLVSVDLMKLATAVLENLNP